MGYDAVNANGQGETKKEDWKMGTEKKGEAFYFRSNDLRPVITAIW